MAETMTINLKNDETKEALKIIKSKGYNISFIMRDFLQSFAHELQKDE